MKIYHNPRCSKSRQTLDLIQEAGAKVEIVDYLQNPPSKEELKKLLEMLGISAEELLRKNEAIFKEKFKGKSYSEDKWIEIMTENPKLIERPIVVKDGKAVLGRPPEKVLDILR